MRRRRLRRWERRRGEASLQPLDRKDESQRSGGLEVTCSHDLGKNTRCDRRKCRETRQFSRSQLFNEEHSQQRRSVRPLAIVITSEGASETSSFAIVNKFGSWYRALGFSCASSHSGSRTATPDGREISQRFGGHCGTFSF